MKTLLIAAGMLAGVTSAALAENGPPGPPSGGYGYGYYDSSGYGAGLYDYSSEYVEPFGFESYGPYSDFDNYRPRGGPGPRVGNGTGAGVGSQR